jgi:hypothetical protein
VDGLVEPWPVGACPVGATVVVVVLGRDLGFGVFGGAIATPAAVRWTVP